MSTESILSLVGIAVTVGLFMLGVVITLVGFLLSRQLRLIEKELGYIRPLETRVTTLEALAGIKSPRDRPSDSIKISNRGSA